MSQAIYYENSQGDTYLIDETSQRILVYLYLHGKTSVTSLVEPVGADDEHEIRKQVRNQIGRTTTGLVGVTHSTQKTLGDQPDNQIRRIQLTDKGESFVERHRADLSMPVDVAELAKRVSQLQIEDRLVDELRAKVNDLEQRIEDLEAQ